MNGVYNFTSEEAKKIYFTSDLHFYHKNIIKYCPENRQYNDVDEMNEGIIKTWNETIPDDAIVFILGDISMGAKDKKVIELLERMKGRKFLCLGNHDSTSTCDTALGDQFEDVQFQYVLRIDGQKIVLNHYPFECWENGGTENGIQFFGHVHTQSVDGEPFVLSESQLDCGWDNHGKPVNYYDAINLLKKKRVENCDLDAFITIGLPGIGKSTWCNAAYPDAISISRDKIRAKLGYTKSEDDKAVLSNEQEYEVTNEQMRLANECAKSNLDIVIDDTNLNRHFRTELVKALRGLGYRINYIVFDPESEENIKLCVDRRNGQIPEDVIRRMSTKYEIPGIMEYDTIENIKTYSRVL